MNDKEHLESIRHWDGFYEKMSKETGWTRLELICQFLRADIQQVHNGLNAQSERVQPITKKLLEELEDGEDWR